MRKSIYDDLDALTDYGIEILKEQRGYKTYYHCGTREFELAELRLIIDAIANNHKVKFQYYSWNVNGEMELRHDGAYYEISPWALVWDDENYYLIGFDDTVDDFKHYRVDKMLHTEEVKQKR